jgi:DNA-binding NtrC family response regulator
LEKPITLQKLMQAVEQGLKRSVVQQTGGGQAVVVPAAHPTLSSPADAQPAFVDARTASQMASLAAQDNSGAQFVLKLDQPLREAKDQFDLAYFNYHLAVEHGSVAKVAEKTGLERTHLYRKLKQMGIDTSKSKH